MNALHSGAPAEGVGLAYHPFLHDAILRNPGLFDFVELPMDLYTDPAQSALLDPGDARLQEIAAVAHCIWRGTVLSLGSAVPSAEPGFSPTLIRRMRHLLAMTQAAGHGAAGYTDAIGFRRLTGCDLGHAQAMPYSDAAAIWTAARHIEASHALGLTVTLAPVHGRTAPPSGPLDDVGFLHRVAAACHAHFALDASWLVGRQSVALAGRVATLSIAGQDEAAWAELPALTRHYTPRAIVVRRDQALFSPHALAADAARAAAALEPTKRAAAATIAPSDLAALYDYQAAFIGYFHGDGGHPVPAEIGHIPEEARTVLASELRQWRNWRKQMDDAHKTQQIAAFLMRAGSDAGRSAP